jgi:peptidyl-tRNA hydrolase
MANIRHVVVVRKDLMLPPGLLAAQVAHISDSFMRQKIVDGCTFTSDELAWLKDPYLSVLGVNCMEDLELILKRTIEEKLPFRCWTDLIPSPTLENVSIKAQIGASIGPADFDKIKIVTGALKLY